MEMNYHLYYLTTLLIKLLPWARKQHLSSMTLKLKSHAVLSRSRCVLPASKANSSCCSLAPSKIQVAVREWHTWRPLASSWCSKLSGFPTAEQEGAVKEGTSWDEPTCSVPHTSWWCVPEDMGMTSKKQLELGCDLHSPAEKTLQWEKCPGKTSL